MNAPSPTPCSIYHIVNYCTIENTTHEIEIGKGISCWNDEKKLTFSYSISTVPDLHDWELHVW